MSEDQLYNRALIQARQAADAYLKRNWPGEKTAYVEASLDRDDGQAKARLWYEDDSGRQYPVVVDQILTGATVESQHWMVISIIGEQLG